MGNRGIPVVNVNNACATGGTMLTVAAMAVASGAAEIVLAVSSDKSAKGFFPALPVYHEEPVPVGRHPALEPGPAEPGLLGPRDAQAHEQLRRHRRASGQGQSDHEQARQAQSQGAVPARVHAWRKCSNSAMVTDPLRLYEICATSDGAGAAILCSIEKAKQFTTKPIRSSRRPWAARSTATRPPVSPW